MSIPTNSRTASVAEPRRTSASVRAKTRPTSAIEPADTNGKSTFTRKSSTATTETRTETRVRDERLVRRTRSPVKKADASGGRKASVQKAAPAVGLVGEDGTGKKAGEWSPRATLLPPSSSAPLASRISVPPLTRHAPASRQPVPLRSLSLEEQERVLIDDLLFVLMGFEGQYITYTASFDPLEEQSRLLGPTFIIAPALDPSLRDLAQSMLKTATHYSALEVFCEVMGREECGSVMHALCAAMRKLLKDYLILIAQLEHQALTNSGFTLHQMNLHLKPTTHMTAQLYSLTQEILKENSLLGPPDAEDDSADDSDAFENILTSLRTGHDPTAANKKSCKGGSLLRLLTLRLQHSLGDPAASALLTNLLRESSRPYMRMLNEWLHHGHVRDPHAEFLIREQKSIKREGLQQDYTDEYWEKRYTIRNELVPPQLEAVKERVLLAGKYLNVVRECGGIMEPFHSNSKNTTDPNNTATTSIPQTFDHPLFLPNVSSAYAHANSTLMALLLTTHHLPSRLRSLKHHFFLDRSDFFSYFLELAAGELRKPAKSVNTGKLQSLLELALRQPGGSAGEIGGGGEGGMGEGEDVRVTMSEMGLTGWLMRVVNVQGMDADASTLSLMTPAAGGTGEVGGKEEKISGYEALTLDYAVPFPLSLIVSRNTLTRYQLLFRYLLSLRHLERQLTGAWTEHVKTSTWTARPGMGSKSQDAQARIFGKKVENWKRRAWCLRARMLCFVQSLLYFCTSEVIEPNWGSFMSRLTQGEEGVVGEERGEGKAKRTVDELMQDHVDFLATCLKECMLTNSKLLRVSSLPFIPRLQLLL